MNDRQQFIGASEAAAALGLSEYKTALELYLEKIGEAPAFTGNLATRVGVAMEPVVLQEFTMRTGHVVTRQQERVPFDARPWLRATLDGCAMQVPAIVEAKSAGDARRWGEDMTDNVPAEYLTQVQVQMACAKLELAFIPVIFLNREYRQYSIRADDELFRMILSGLDDFWARVQRRDPPDPATYDDIKRRFPKDDGGTVVATPEVEAACGELRRIKSQISELDAAAEMLEGEIKTFMADNGTLTGSAGATLGTWKATKPLKWFDAKRLEAEAPEVHARYMAMKQGSRRFLLKQEK